MQTEVVRVTPVVPVRDRNVTCASAHGASQRKGQEGKCCLAVPEQWVHLTPTLAAVNKTSFKADGAILQNSSLPPPTLSSKYLNAREQKVCSGFLFVCLLVCLFFTVFLLQQDFI